MLDVEAYLDRLENPPYATMRDVVARALPSIRPPRRIDVPGWAEADRMVRTPTYSGRWKNDVAPYMVEPSRMATSRQFGAVVFVGPARTIKTDSLILNAVGHRVCCMPRTMLVVCPTKDAAREFSITKLDPMIRATDAVKARQLKGRSADNTFDKLFAGNMRLRIGWPVIGQLSMVDIPDVLLTDYDRMVDDVDGEGSPFDLARKRTQTFGSLGMTIAESSPGRMVEVDDHTPTTPHEAPPCGGLLGVYNTGTRGRRYWICEACHDPFMPVFENLHWEDRGTNADSAATVEMVCPKCGHCMPPDRKIALEAAGLWLHEARPADDGSVDLVEVDDAALRATDVVSYWCEGPIAALQDWKQLVLRELDARDLFNATGDETRLKATVTLDQGRPYVPRIRSVGDGVNEEALKALSERYPMRIAPTETRFITVQVDVQATRFVVQVDAWGVGLERWLIDRFDLAVPPPNAPGAELVNGQPTRAIAPPQYQEDWAALDDLLSRSWPVAGTGHSLLARAMIVDTGGAPGTTANAYKWWRGKKAEGQVHRAFILKGVPGLNRDRASYVAPEKVEGTRQKRRTDIRLVRVGTDPLKDEIMLALTRKEAGPGKYHLPEALADNYFAEFCAEIRTPRGWDPRKHGIRNESLDLAVYGKALTIVLKAEKIDWEKPPAWAAAIPDNNYQVAAEVQETAPAPATPQQPVRRRRVLSRGI